jgi:hypothetical protein
LHLGKRDSSTRQFQNTLHLQTNRGHSEGHQATPHLNDLQIAIQTYNIDLEGHPESMDAGRGFNPQTSAGVQTSATEQSEHPLHGRISQLDAFSYNGSPGCVGYSEHKNFVSATQLQLDSLLLSAVDNDSQNGSSKNTRNNLNSNHDHPPFR